MSASAYLCIIIDTLVLQYAFYSKSEEGKVSEAYNCNPIRLMDAYYISQFSLNRRDYTSAEYHHDQKSRTLSGVFS